MTCAYCGTELPAEALFCGECGRSIASSSGRTAPVAVAGPREPVAFAAPAADTALDEFDGATIATRARRAPATVAPPAQPEPDIEPDIEPERVPEPVAEPEPAPQPEPAAEPEPEPEPEPLPESVVVVDAPAAPARDAWMPPQTLLRTSSADEGADLERTRIVSSTSTSHRFVLQFSTGESVTVAGNGLVGRNPSPEPAEYFDHLVTIVDPGKSVSKTHLEFGQVAGSFWISDRFSGNGTVVREPDSAPRRCEPGKRYRIARGTRVSMGEQFFVVS